MGLWYRKLNYDLNLLIRRKNYDNFIKGGDKNMNFRISDEVSKIAVETIKKDELNEGIVNLKNQLSFLTNDNFENMETLDDEKIKFLNIENSKIKSKLDALNFKKDSLLAIYNNNLSKFDIKNSVRLKEEICNIEKDIDILLKQKNENDELVAIDGDEYKRQLDEVREKYDNVDIMKYSISSAYSKNVVSNYKKERATKLVSQFLDSLDEDKKQQVLLENQDLKGYLNVGENI